MRNLLLEISRESEHSVNQQPFRLFDERKGIATAGPSKGNIAYDNGLLAGSLSFLLRNIRMKSGGRPFMGGKSTRYFDILTPLLKQIKAIK